MDRTAEADPGPRFLRRATIAAFAALLPLGAGPALAQDQTGELADYLIYSCQLDRGPAKPLVFRRMSDGSLSALTGKGLADLGKGEPVSVAQNEPDALMITRGNTIMRLTDSLLTILPPKGEASEHPCTRLDEAYMAALGAIAGDTAARDMAQGEILSEARDIGQAQRDQEAKRIDALEAEVEQLRAAQAAPTDSRQPIERHYSIGSVPSGAMVAPSAEGLRSLEVAPGSLSELYYLQQLRNGHPDRDHDGAHGNGRPHWQPDPDRRYGDDRWDRYRDWNGRDGDRDHFGDRFRDGQDRQGDGYRSYQSFEGSSTRRILTTDP